MFDNISQLTDLPFYLIVTFGLITGLAGSVHCTGMCGGLVMALTKDKKGILSYHIGRLVGYLSIGLIIPLMGLEAMGLRENKTLSLIAALSLGATFIFIGLKNFFNFKMSIKLHRSIERLNHNIWKGLFKYLKDFDLLRAFLGGSASALLPCGLLWTVLILSLTASSPTYSVLFIISFWLGTTPALSFAPGIIKKVLLPIEKKLPKVVPTMFIVIGLATLTSRVYGLYVQTGAHSCH